MPPRLELALKRNPEAHHLFRDHFTLIDWSICLTSSFLAIRREHTMSGTTLAPHAKFVRLQRLRASFRGFLQAAKDWHHCKNSDVYARMTSHDMGCALLALEDRCMGYRVGEAGPGESQR